MVTTLQAQVDGQQQALNEVRDANQAQSLALSKERARLQTALEKIDEVGLLIETIQAEAAEELAEETRKKEAYNEEVSSLMGFVTELNEELQLLKNERAEREHELAELKEAVDDQQRAAAFELEGALSDKDKAELTLVRVQQALELAQTATKNAEARAKFAEDEVVELETEKNKLFREIDELLVIQTDLNEELKVYKEDQMGEDLEEYRHKLEDLSAQMKVGCSCCAWLDSVAEYSRFRPWQLMKPASTTS
jgi:chromosome segregation ATPase